MGKKHPDQAQVIVSVLTLGRGGGKGPKLEMPKFAGKSVTGKSGNAPNGSTPSPATQMKRLSRGEIDILKKAGYSPEQLKTDVVGPNSSRYDIFKNQKQDLFVKPKDGSGPGEPLNLNMGGL
ncbi:hypothetical protein IPP75_01130 [Candidatus Saccharibacteria bacterium]|nr:MAG: hypothetical protein IPP75_01130 [Candidatus Saccharibacteria bacterium]